MSNKPIITIKSSGYEAAFKVLFAFLITPFAVIFQGYVLTILWRWFIVKHFGIIALDIPTAIGITLITSYITHQDMSDIAEKQDKSSFWQKMITALLRPAFILFFGWIINHWMA